MRNKTLQAVSLAALAVGLAGTSAWAQIPGLQNQDVGVPFLAGSATFADGKYTIVGGGNDIWGSFDNFHYAYITVTGDFDYIVKVESLEGPDGWTKAELMAREIDQVTAVPDGGDRHISSMTTRSAGQNEVGLQFRSDARSSGSAWPNDIGIATPLYRPTYPNTWLRLERMGSMFWGYASTDGNTWTVLRGSPYDFLALNGTETLLRADGNMANTLALGMAVTAHNDTDTTGGVGVFSGWRQMTPVPINITTQPPAVINAAANSTLTITAAATGDPVHYQWQRNNEDIPGAISATYTKVLVQTTDSGSYTVKCFGSGQTTKTSSACVVTITVDSTKPTIVEAVGSVGFTEATITFSEPMADPSATATANYTIAGLAVSGATLSADGFKVTLTTAKQAEGTDYTITVNNVQDTAGNAIAAGSVVLFKSFSFLSGNAVMELWPDTSNLTSFMNTRIGYAAPPTDPISAGTTTILSSFEAPSWENGTDYGGRIFGWFMPPTTGDYVFYVCSDDSSFLLLSSDETPANKRKIATDPSWDNQRSWKGSLRRGYAVGATDSDNGRDPDLDLTYLNQSDQCIDTEWGGEAGLPSGNYVIHLEQGKRYYMEGLWKEGGGGDGIGANYRLVTEDEATIILDNATTRITGAVIGAYADTSKLPPTITTHPVNDLTLDSGGTATLSVVAQNPAPGPLSYQWTRNGVNIAGATSAEYTIANAGPNDMGQYRVIVSNKNGSITSGGGSPNPTVVMVKATGVFTIEVEDFNTGGGQTKPEASVMPYLGGAYADLTAVYDIDYHNKDLYTDSQTDGHPVYRYQPGGGSDLEAGDPDRRGVSIGGNLGGQWGTTRLGDWDVTVNYKIGWVGGGDWGNYTRTFPSPAKDYYVFAAASYDGVDNGQVNGSIGLVTAGVDTTTQTVVPIGTYTAQGSGDWSRNNLVPLRDSSGELQRVSIGGTQTIRWTYNSGDSDYLVFIPADGGTAVGSASITLSGGNVVIAENPPGTAIVQMTTTLGGTWTDVGAAPQTVPVTGTTAYFRLKQP